ncbi:MAG: hypothetical protein V3S24_17365 [Candidatus Tectomicrobia bacterium]
MMKRVLTCKVIALFVVVGFLGACASTYKEREISHKETVLDRPESSLRDNELLSVRIEAFDPGSLPEDPNLAKGLSMEIRNAESYYVPVQLKNAMERSGHWGLVRVVPKGTREGEVIVTGKIIESDGEILKLSVNVKDATGVNWFSKDYESVVSEDIYKAAEEQNIDVFHFFYNQIANDIAGYKKKLSGPDKLSIRQVSELRFGADFAPNLFKDFISKAPQKEISSDQDDPLQQLITFINGPKNSDRSKPVYTVLRLPAEEDPIVKRVQRIRSREEFLIDTLDQQYDSLARDITDAYSQWRRSRLTEINAIREADRVKRDQQGKALAIGILGALAGAAIASNRNCYSCASTGAAIATVAVAIAVQKAVQASKQAEADTSLRKIALEELGQSLVSDVKPVVIEVEGRTVELTGTVEEKFQKWREILKELRKMELGPLPKDTSAAAGS